MKKDFFLKDGNLWKSYKLNQLATTPDGEDDVEESVDAQWQEKARKLQIRRWRKIKHQLA